jgi:hypothetical protein
MLGWRKELLQSFYLTSNASKQNRRQLRLYQPHLKFQKHQQQHHQATLRL